MQFSAQSYVNVVAQRQVFVRQAGWSLDAVSAALQLLAMSGLLMLRQAYACAGRVRHAGGDWHVYACRDAQLSLARPSGSASCCLAAPKASLRSHLVPCSLS